MKIKNFIKMLFFHILSLFLVVWWFVVYAINFPSWTPVWETSWWVFQTNFNKIFNALSFDWTRVWIGDSTPDGTLKLDVEWNIGATNYCDQNGLNCKTTTQMAVDTNANTICSGTYTYLNGDGACRDVRTDGDINDTDTNANTLCSWTYTYLNWDWACRDVRIDWDINDTNTDNQTLSFAGNTLSIVRGNSVSLPVGITGTKVAIYACPQASNDKELSTCENNLSQYSTCHYRSCATCSYIIVNCPFFGYVIQ
jgi:hypothetical protein